MRPMNDNSDPRACQMPGYMVTLDVFLRPLAILMCVMFAIMAIAALIGG